MVLYFQWISCHALLEYPTADFAQIPMALCFITLQPAISVYPLLILVSVQLFLYFVSCILYSNISQAPTDNYFESIVCIYVYIEVR